MSAIFSNYIDKFLCEILPSIELAKMYFKITLFAGGVRSPRFLDIVKRQIKIPNASQKQTEVDVLKNEPVLEYLPKSCELTKLQKSMEVAHTKTADIPIVIDGQEYRTSLVKHQIIPYRRKQNCATFYHADEILLNKAIETAIAAQVKWDQTDIDHRLKIWEKAANLMQTNRADLVAATMVGQGKTVYQAEIDAGAELIDFTRMNALYLKQLLNYEPISVDERVTKNHIRFRGLDGFVAAISPFNFTAIGGNLAYTPALMGNAVLWKPSDSAILSSWRVFNLMREAGVPDGVVNFVPCDGPTFGNIITSSKHLAAINFTGSNNTFKWLWKEVAKNLDFYRNFPRLIGECGGKNFHFVHHTADPDTVVAATIRSAFEYSGQKCSACSRLYVPEKLWLEELMKPLVEKTCELIVGEVCNFECFSSAVIDETAFMRIVDYIEHAKKQTHCEILVGGNCNNLKGYYVEPTIIVTRDPEDRLLREEIFGPVLTVFVYKDKDLEKTFDLVKNATDYALTGAVFAHDEAFLEQALNHFKSCAGNFYINDKSTGAVVGQQPFGGGRMSGTNDKAGSPHYLLRFTSQQAIKETFEAQPDVYYPYMEPALKSLKVHVVNIP